MIYIFWSCRDKNEAKRIIRQLLEKKWIACASIFPNVESIYEWEGKVEEANEVKVILKSVTSQFDAIAALIQKECSYEVPEILQVDIAKGNTSYLAWLEKIIK